MSTAVGFIGNRVKKCVAAGPRLRGILPRFAVLMVTTCAFAANSPRFVYTADSGLEMGAVTMDARGNTYLTGGVGGSPFTATPGAFQSKSAGGTCYGGGGIGPPIMIPCRNVFVIKLDPAGAVVFATYLGGTGDVEASAIMVDSDENVYVAGTISNGGGSSAGTFPTTPGAAFTSVTYTTGFVAKLNSTGTQLVYSTVIPGAGVSAITIDGAGNAYFTGYWNVTIEQAFPATAGAYQTAPASPAAVVGKLDPSGSTLLYGTFLSGSQGGTGGTGIALDASGNVLVAGTTNEADFPATSGQFSTSAIGSANAFIAQLTADGSDLVYATLLGPAQVSAMKVDAQGYIYVACSSAGADFPATVPGFGVAPPTGSNGDLLVRVSADGSTVLYSIYLPFASPWIGMDVDSGGNAYVAGWIEDGSMQVSMGALQTAFGGGTTDVAIGKITPGGQVAGATYLGGSGTDAAQWIAAGRDGSVTVAGRTTSADFPGLTTAAPALGELFAANFFPAITIQNSASYVANTAVPGEMVSIRGYGIGPDAGLVSAPVMQLGGVQVYFDGFSAPMIYAQAAQINVQAPWEIAGQTTTVMRVVYNGAEVGRATVAVGQAQPGAFYIENSDDTRNSTSNPAQAGDFVSVYGTGGGATNPPGVTGGFWPLAPLSFVKQAVSAKVGGEAAGIMYAGSAPTLGSFYFQINVRLPADLTAAARTLCVTIGGVKSAPVEIAIRGAQ